MRAALHEAEAAGLPVSMVDRDIGTTLKRVWRNVSWWQRMQLGSGLFASLITRETVSPESIEQLKEGDVLESTFAEFAEQSEKLYEPLITERDRYMALRLMEDLADRGYRNVLVVIGAGHLKGLRAHLEGENATNPAAEREALDTIPPGSRFFQYLPWIVAALVLAGFAIGFSRDTDLGIQLVTEWFLINGVLSALGLSDCPGPPPDDHRNFSCRTTHLAQSDNRGRLCCGRRRAAGPASQGRGFLKPQTRRRKH